MARPRTAPIEVVATIGGVRLRRRRGERAFFFVSGMTIDADGAPRAYHPNGSPPGLDHLANAGHPGDWWALVTERGVPVVQRASDPARGFYVSMTSLQDPARPKRDPRRYVDSASIPYIVLPERAQSSGGARQGDFAAVRNKRNGRVSFAILADTGPPGKIGEGSMALARALAIPHSPKSGGQAGDVAYVVFARSGNRRPRPRAEIDREAAALLEQWGGNDRLGRL